MSDGLSFGSKVDLWLLIVLLVVFSICVFPALSLLGEGGAGARAVAVLLLAFGALPVWILLATRYVLSDEELRIRCGPFKWTVPLREITAVTPTRSPLSSPALSLDRLRIDYGNGRSILISPEQRNAFLRSLEARRS